MGESNTNGYLLPDKAYQSLKWLALIALPAVARQPSRTVPTNKKSLPPIRRQHLTELRVELDGC